MRTKALEWVKHPHANLWRADCLTGRYQVYAITSPITWGFDGFDGLTEVFGESPTEEAAKAAAQSHFDAAVSSVLEDDWQMQIGDHVRVRKERHEGDPAWLSDWRTPEDPWRGYIVGLRRSAGGAVSATVTDADDIDCKHHSDGFEIEHLELIPAPPKAGE